MIKNHQNRKTRDAKNRLRRFVILFGNILDRERVFDFDTRQSIGSPGLDIKLDDDLAVFALEEMLTRELLADPIEPSIRDEAFDRLMATREFPSDRPRTREAMEAVFRLVDQKEARDVAA